VSRCSVVGSLAPLFFTTMGASGTAMGAAIDTGLRAAPHPFCSRTKVTRDTAANPQAHAVGFIL